MKVCLVAPTTYPAPPRAYGGETMVWLLARSLGEMGHEVHLLAPGGSKTPPNGRLHYVRGSYGMMGFAYDFEAWDLYKEVILGCDVVHDWSHSAAVLEQVWMERPEHPVLMTYNGVAFTRPRFAKRNATVASHAHLRHALNGWGAYEGVEGVVVEGENVGRLKAAEVVYWGTDTDFYTPDPEPLAEIEHPKGEIRPGYLLYIGRPHPAKGVDLLFELAARHPDEQIVLAWRAANDDHRHWERGYLEASTNYPNLFILQLPEVGHHEAKRMLYRNAKLFFSPARYLECFVPETPIVTPTGWRPIVDIRRGDRVLNREGHWTEVLGTQARPHVGPVLTIMPRVWRVPITCTPEHKFRVLRPHNVERPSYARARNREPERLARRELYERALALHGQGCDIAAIADAVGVPYTTAWYWVKRRTAPYPSAYSQAWVEARALQVGDWIGLPVSSSSTEDAELSEPLLTLLGYYLAEGFPYRGREVRWAFGHKEPHYAEEVAGLCERVFGRRGRIYRQAVTLVVSCSSQVAHDTLLSLGGHGARTKAIAERVMALPPARVIPLLRAYLNGDGCLTRSGAYAHIVGSTASPSLAFQMGYLLLRLGLIPQLQSQIQSAKSFGAGNRQYRVVVRSAARQLAALIGWDYPPEVRQFRWTSHGFFHQGMFWLPIGSIKESLYVGEVHDLTTDGSFVAGIAAVHNCFGLTGVEAMACGTPAVLGANGAGPEILDRPELGATARTHKQEHALSDLEVALERVHEYDGQAARQAVVERFSGPIITRAYLELYERAIAGERW